MSEGESPKQPGLMPWAFWGLGAMLFFYGFFQRVAPSVMVADLMRDFAVGGAILGNLSAFYFYAYAGAQLPVGLLVDRFGPRRMLAGAAFLCAGGSLLFALADGVGEAYAGRLLIGLGAGFSFVGTLKLSSIWFPVHRFAMLSGLTMTLGMIGGVIGQAPLAVMVESFGWRGTMAWASAAGLGLAVLIGLVVRDGRAGEARAVSGLSIPEALRSVVQTPQTWIIALVGGGMTASLLAFAGLWAVPFLIEARGVDKPVAAGLASMVLIGWAVGAPTIGWLSDRIGRRKPPMIAMAVLSLVVIAAVIYVPGLPLWSLYPLLVVQGVGSAGMVVCFATSREHNHPAAAGTAVAFVNMMVVGSGAVFQPVIGWLLDLNWDGRMAAGSRVYSLDAYHAAFGSLIAAGVAAIILAMLVRETNCRPVREA